jgi:hypothetical protein
MPEVDDAVTTLLANIPVLPPPQPVTTRWVVCERPDFDPVSLY